MTPKLRIPTGQINAYLQRYSFEADSKLAEVSAAAKRQRYLTPNQLHEIAHWKSKRRAALVFENEDVFVREITKFSFQASHENSRIGALTLLRGVSYPTASVVLHFCVDSSYPILDFRAIWSLGLEKPPFYSPEYWVKYVEVCRTLADKHGLSIRDFDKALWQYSSEHQPPP